MLQWVLAGIMIASAIPVVWFLWNTTQKVSEQIGVVAPTVASGIASLAFLMSLMPVLVMMVVFMNMLTTFVLAWR